MLNVLQLIPSFHQGGSERQAVQLARLLNESGRCRVSVACLERNGVLLDDISRLGLDEIPEYPLTSFYDLNAMKRDLSAAASQLDAAAAKSNNATARNAIKKFSADLKELVDDLNNGKQPAADLISRIEADGPAVDTACGR